jgi:hypothetical protein
MFILFPSVSFYNYREQKEKMQSKITPSKPQFELIGVSPDIVFVAHGRKRLEK